jgi:ketosteroid isomerase-like protein
MEGALGSPDWKCDPMNWEHVVEIQQVVNGYFRALDEKDLDAAHLRRILTDDAKVIRPNGAAMIGPETIGQSHRESMARFESTQHIITSHDVAVDGDTATVRANLVAIHIWPGARTMLTKPESYFAAGGVVTAQLVRTGEGWRISEMSNRVLWRAGGGFERVMATGAPKADS